MPPQDKTLTLFSNDLREELSYGNVKLKLKKHFTQEQALRGISADDYAEYVFLAFDRDAKSATKVFSAIPRAEWSKIPILLASDRHAYEWITPNIPIRPYMDLEIEGADMTREESAIRLTIFTNYLCTTFNERFDTNISSDDMTILNSSRPGKMSYHILITDGVCFAKMSDHHRFMQWFFREFENAPKETREALCWEKGGKSLLVFDMSVYANQQKFRCMNQSKKGKAHFLALESAPIASIDTLVGLYEGVGDRRVLNVEALDVGERCVRSSSGAKRGVPRAGPNVIAGYCVEGVSLHSKSGESFDKLLERPDEVQFLRLIPNSPTQQWEFYRNTAYMCFVAGVPEEEFEQWARLSPAFDSRDSIVAGYARQRVKPEYDAAGCVAYLRKYARQSNPEFFKTGERLHAQYYKPDFDGFETIVEKSAFVSQEGTEWAADIESPHRIILIKADLGAGKTTAIKRILPAYPRVLILTPRIAYCKHAVIEFGVASYLEGKFDEPRLACSLESLHKVPDTATYDIVILDECEAILSIFSSTTLDRRQVETYNTLARILNASEKAIFAGAFITQKTVDFVRSFDVPTLLIKHDKPRLVNETPKTAIEIEWGLFHVSLINYLKGGGKPYVYWASKNAANEFMAQLRGAARENPDLQKIYDNMLYYSADADDSIFQNLDDINNAWDEVRMVMATPSITVGNSYSPKTTTFSSVWIYGYPSCIVADLFQGHKRVRHTTTGTLYFLIPYAKLLVLAASARGELLSTLGAFDELTTEKRLSIAAAAEKQRARAVDRGEYAEEYSAIIRSLGPEYEQTPAPLRNLLFFNNLEGDLSARYFRSMFLNFVKMCGYTVQKRTRGERDMRENELHDAKTELIDNKERDKTYYGEVEEADWETVEDIQRRIKRKESTRAEKMRVQKYFFDLHIDPSLPPWLKQLYFDKFCDPAESRVLRNLFAEAKKLDTSSFNADYLEKKTNAETLSMAAVKLAIIRDINRRLGLSHTFAGSSISRTQIEGITDYLFSERRRISLAFKFRDKFKKKEASHADTIEMLKKIYESWGNGKLVGDVDARTKRPSTQYWVKHKVDNMLPPYAIEIDSEGEIIPVERAPYAEFAEAFENVYCVEEEVPLAVATPIYTLCVVEEFVVANVKKWESGIVCPTKKASPEDVSLAWSQKMHQKIYGGAPIPPDVAIPKFGVPRRRIRNIEICVFRDLRF